MAVISYVHMPKREREREADSAIQPMPPLLCDSNHDSVDTKVIIACWKEALKKNLINDC